MVAINKIRVLRSRSRDKDYILEVIGRQRSSDSRDAEKYYRRYFEDKNRPRDRVFVVKDKKMIIGVSGYFYDDYSDSGIYWLGWTYVESKNQRRGIGKALLSHIFRELREKSARKIYVDTSSKSFYRGARRFYLKQGFKKEGVFKDYYDHGEDQIVYSKEV